MNALVRCFKQIVGIPLKAEDHKLLWAAQDPDDLDPYEPPESRLCATQEIPGKWDIRAYVRHVSFPAPLLWPGSSSTYEPAGLPLYIGLSTSEMVRILRTVDQRDVPVPGHISQIAPR